MPYIRTRELVGFQRWIVGAYDKRVTWEDFKAAGFEPRKLAPPPHPPTPWRAAHGYRDGL